MLLGEGLISRDQFDRATLHQSSHGGTIGHYLVTEGILPDEELARFIARRFPVAHWPKNRLANIHPAAIAMIAPKLARSLRILPLDFQGDKLVLGMTDPSNNHVIQEVAHHTGRAVIPALVSELDISWAFDIYYAQLSTPPEPAQPDEQPLPLFQRITRDFSKPGKAPVGDQNVEAAPRSTSGGISGHSIEDAVRAIPLVKRIPSRPKLESTPQRAHSVTREKRRTSGKVGAPVEAKLPRSTPAYDSWSKPAAPPAPKPAHSVKRTDPPLQKDMWPRGKISDDNSPGLYGATASETPKAPSTPAQRKRTEGEIIAAIGRAKNRDEIISLALEALTRFAKRAVFFTVRRSEIRGFSIVGDFTSIEAARSFWVPVSTPSTLSKAVKDKQIHLGPLARNPADSVLAASLGGRPDRTVVIPLAIHDKTIGILYADRIDEEVPPRHRLVRLAEITSENLSRLLHRKKQQ